jgi:hypothetical protein
MISGGDKWYIKLSNGNQDVLKDITSAKMKSKTISEYLGNIFWLLLFLIFSSPVVPEN